MTKRRDLNWSNRDLRNRSFRGLDLKGADFSGSDIRGCNFSSALLTGANFEQVRTGITLRRVLILMTVAAIAAVVMASTVIRTVFSALGEAVGGQSWLYIMAMLVGLGLSGAGPGLRIGVVVPSPLVAFVLSGTATGALLGFVNGGLAADENLRVAAATAVLGGLLMGFFSLRFRTGVVVVAVAIAAAGAAYGLVFWLWATALACFGGQEFGWGIGLSMLLLIYLGLTLSSLSLAAKEIKMASGTSFKDADLTNALFGSAKLTNTDFSGAIGFVGDPIAREE